MRTLLLSAIAVGFLGLGGTAYAGAQPDGSFVPNPGLEAGLGTGPGQGTPQGCGLGSAQIKQNGQFVSGNQPGGGDTPGFDQTTGPHTRADLLVGVCNNGNGTPGG